MTISWRDSRNTVARRGRRVTLCQLRHYVPFRRIMRWLHPRFHFASTSNKSRTASNHSCNQNLTITRVIVRSCTAGISNFHIFWPNTAPILHKFMGPTFCKAQSTATVQPSQDHSMIGRQCRVANPPLYVDVLLCFYSGLHDAKVPLHICVEQRPTLVKPALTSVALGHYEWADERM